MKDDLMKLVKKTFAAMTAKAVVAAEAQAKAEAEAKAKAEAEAKAKAEAPLKIADEAIALFWEKAQERAEEGEAWLSWVSVFQADEYGLDYGTYEGFPEALGGLSDIYDIKEAVEAGKELFANRLEALGFEVDYERLISWKKAMWEHCSPS